MIIDDSLLDLVVKNLSNFLLQSLIKYSCAGWTVVSERSNLNFQFVCTYYGKMKKTKSFDFTMAKSESEWLKILDSQAKDIVREISITVGEFPSQWKLA